jgi:F-type H+-transporting ATPase subunit delta
MTDAREYGKALFLLSEDEGVTEEVRFDAECLQTLLSENPEYIRLLDTPALSKEERLSAIDESLATLNKYLKNLVKMFSEHNSVYMIPSALDGFLKEYAESRGIAEVEAVSAIPLTDSQISRLKERLSKETGKTVVLKNTVDASILGGMKLIGMGMQLDSSLKTRLEDISRSIRNTIV